MNFIDKYATACKRIYFIILTPIVPGYLLLYGASGHAFNPPPADVLWMTLIVLSVVIGFTFFAMNDREGIVFNSVKILFGGTLLLAAYGGLSAFKAVVTDDDELGFVFTIIACTVPLLFTFSAVVLFLKLWRK